MLLKRSLTKRVTMFALALLLAICTISIVVLAGTSTSIAHAAVLPPDQILPGEVGTGSGSYVYFNQGEYDGKLYKVYRNNKLRATPVELASSQGHEFRPSTGNELPISWSKSKDESYSVGVEVASSLGVSAGADAFGVEATFEVDVTSTLGLTASVGKGYTESISYTLNPNTDKAGIYYIVTNAFVRDYRVDTYEWTQVQIGTKTVRLWYTLWIATRQEPVYEWQWVKTRTAYTCFPESYYYTLQYFA